MRPAPPVHRCPGSGVPSTGRESEHDGIESLIVERKALCAPEPDLDSDIRNGRTRGGTGEHAWVGVDEYNIIDGGWIVAEVGSGASSDVENATARSVQQHSPPRAECLVLDSTIEPVVHCRGHPLEDIRSKLIVEVDSGRLIGGSHFVLA